MPPQLPSFRASQQRSTMTTTHAELRTPDPANHRGKACRSWPMRGTAAHRRPHVPRWPPTLPADRAMATVQVGDGARLPSRKVQVSDAELIHRACQASVASRNGRLLRVPSVMWDCKDLSGFAMLSRRVGPDFEVLVTGEVACDVCDLEPLLRPRTESDYNVVARELYGDQFIYGSLVHEVHQNARTVEDWPPDVVKQDKNKKTRDDEWNVEAEDSATVRTACFARARSFARNEEWCFLEHFRPRAVPLSNAFATTGSTTCSSTSGHGGDDPFPGFSIVLSSLPESDLRAGKMKQQRVLQLHGITATYFVEAVAPTIGYGEPRARVSFRATYRAPSILPDGWADSKTVRARLLAIARSLHRLPDLVLHRQQLASRWSQHGSFSTRSGQEVRDKDEADIVQCVACTKRLRIKLLHAPTRRSKRCEICMYRACASCWSKENVETFSGPMTSVVICRRCHENFRDRDYAHIQGRTSAQDKHDLA